MARGKTIYIDSSKMTEVEWQLARMDGLGGSDIGTVLNLNPYKAPIQLFWEKVTRKIVNIDNEATFAGKVLEDLVADVYWAHWDPEKASFEALSANYKEGLKMRSSRKIKKIVKNEKYPWLLGNIDRAIQKSYYRSGNGVLEVKTGLSQAWDKYEACIPPSYVIQPQVYLMLLPNNYEYCELAALIDGRYFKTFEFDRNATIEQMILDGSKKFWDTVLQARGIWDNNAIPAEEKTQMISMLEPSVDGSEGWQQFLKETYAETGPPIQGTEKHMTWGAEYHKAKEAEKEAKERADSAGNELKNALRIHGSSVIDCGEFGEITWRPDKNGTLRFNVSKKLKEWNS